MDDTYHHVYDNQTAHKIMGPLYVTPCGAHEGAGEPRTS